MPQRKSKAMWMQWKLWALLVVVGFILSLFPYETTVVPAWKVRVVDETGKPYEGVLVRQTWKHYTYERDAGQHREDQRTDNNGYVSFSERTIAVSLLSRMVLTMYSAAMTLAHGSSGIFADVAAIGPEIYKTLDYEKGKPLPEQILLPSNEAGDLRKKN